MIRDIIFSNSTFVIDCLFLHCGVWNGEWATIVVVLTMVDSSWGIGQPHPNYSRAASHILSTAGLLLPALLKYERERASHTARKKQVE